MGPLFQQLVSATGRRADDPVVVTFVTDVLGQKIPAPTTDAAHTKYVSAKKHGLGLAFTHDIKNEKYPPVPKTKSTFVSYLGDLVAVFGGREGPTGHIEPVLDDDTASAVSKATPALDARFAAWLA